MTAVVLTTLMPYLAGLSWSALMASAPMRLYMANRMVDLADSIVFRVSGYAQEGFSPDEVDKVTPILKITQTNARRFKSVSHPMLKQLEQMDFFSQVQMTRALLRDLAALASANSNNKAEELSSESNSLESNQNYMRIYGPWPPQLMELQSSNETKSSDDVSSVMTSVEPSTQLQRSPTALMRSTTLPMVAMPSNNSSDQLLHCRESFICALRGVGASADRYLPDCTRHGAGD